ncbi:CD3324 family protein [Clostridioides difficile]|uniref:CD3324 family protein n=1 Tax=Clostridioides difficile TaxID=1496 RepID=UPI002030B694|nr:CD3324 family protein [Clostridioides difficile]MCM0744926.1 CD3324 family protein [Clostridioides difficile]
MKYVKANSILPISLIEELQNYIQGGYIYIPSKNENKKGWGELSGYKREIEKRNKKIRMDYKHGKSLEELSKSYFLSIHSIRKIIYK